MAEIGPYIALATFAVGIIAYAVKLTWQVRSIEKEVREDMDAQIDNVQRDIKNVEAGSLSRAETLRHETGEMGSALRTKIHEIETWNRDTFVRKDSFEQAITRMEKSFEKIADKLEEKIEKAIERIRRQD